MQTIKLSMQKNKNKNKNKKNKKNYVTGVPSFISTCRQVITLQISETF